MNGSDEKEYIEFELKNDTVELEAAENPHVKEEIWDKIPDENDDDEIETKNEIRNTEPLLEIKNNDFYCAFCKVHFRFAKHYEKHFSKRHPHKKAFPCPICPYGSGLRRLILLHVDKYHPGKVNAVINYERSRTFRCAICDLDIKGSRVFDKHALTVHKGMKMVECSQCEVKYFRQNALTAHKKKKHSGRSGETNFRCQFCRNVFHRSDELKSHEIWCKERQAKKIIHAGAVRAELPHFKTLEFQNTCRTCGEKFQYMTHLKVHLSKRHPEATKTIFPCVYCKKAFTTRLVLDKHLDKYHAEIDKNPRPRYRKGGAYRCEYCSSEFRLLNRYETHVKHEHPDQKSFRCSICGLGFHLKQSLTRHVKALHGRPVLSCEYCGLSFAIINELRVHGKGCGKNISAAGKGSEFFCDICQRMRSGTLQSHKKNHQNYDHCPFCDKRFHRLKNIKGLQHHLMRRHSNKMDNAAYSQDGQIIHSRGEECVKVEWGEEADLPKEEDGIEVELKDGICTKEKAKGYDMKKEVEEEENVKEELENSDEFFTDYRDD